MRPLVSQSEDPAAIAFPGATGHAAIAAFCHSAHDNSEVCPPVPVPCQVAQASACGVERSSTISRLKKVAEGVLELLREIGDENAYARHLSAHAVAHSPAEWRKFSDERFRAKYQKAKCC
jgi:hypothetical protein